MPATVWTRDDWNDLIGRINGLADDGCIIAEELEEVFEDHIWSVQDIIDARDKLTEICANSPTFSTETVKWTQEIIDELNDAIDNCECISCPVGYVDIPDELSAFTMTTFGTATELWDNEHAELVNEEEGTDASDVATEEWTVLNGLLNENPTQEEVDDQVDALNLAADLAWGYISGTATIRHNYDSLYDWLDPDQINTVVPTLHYFEFGGVQYKQWRMCQTRATIRIEDAGCWGDPPSSYIIYSYEYYFTGSPDGAFFLSGTYGVGYGEPKLFGRNSDKACAADFVGDGDCPSVQRCVDYLNEEGVTHKVIVTYVTTELWSAAWPV